MVATKTRKEKKTSHSITRDVPLDIQKYRTGYDNGNRFVDIPIALSNCKVSRFVPRDDQLEIVNYLFKQHFGKKNACIQSPTGAGKGYMLSLFVANILLIGDRKKVLIIVPSKELVEDLTEYFNDLLVAKVYTGSGNINYEKPIMISTYQSVRRRIERFKPDLIISDEAHRAASDTWHKALMCQVQSFSGITDTKETSSDFLRAQHHGFTATPARLDRRSLLPYFDSLWVSPPVDWYIKQGILPDFELNVIDCPGFSTQGGKNDNLSKQSEIFGAVPEIEKTVNIYCEQCMGEPSLFFVTGVAHGDKMVEMFAEKGVEARFIHSKTPKAEREQDFQDFRDNKYQVLINITIFKEGVNIHTLKNLFLCRFTYSLSLFMQMSGRLFRGKFMKRLFDLVGNSFYHGSPKLLFPWQLEPYFDKDNNPSSRILCPHCGEPLFPKKYLPKDRNYEGCCTNCENEVTIYCEELPEVELEDEDKANININETDFNLLKGGKNDGLLDPHDMTRFTRIIFNPRLNQISKTERICNIDFGDKYPKELVQKAKYTVFIQLGLSKSTANFHAYDD